MLNRIRVRGKLLLLLATPLLALIVFAYLGVVERLDTASSQTREQSIAQLADSGSDLSRAIADQRLVVLMVDAGAETDLNGWSVLTQEAILNWLSRATTARSQIETAEAASQIDDLTLTLNDRIANGTQPGRSATTRLAELSQLSRSIDEVNQALVGEASGLDLYRALFEQGYANDMQDAATVIAMVGADSIRSGEVSQVAAELLNDASVQFSDAMTGFRDQATPEHIALLADLRNASVLPRSDGAPGQTMRDLQPLVTRADSGSRIQWLDIGMQRVDGIHGLSEGLLGEASGLAADRAQFAQQSARNFLVLAGSVILGALLMAVLIGRSISRPLIRLSRSARQLSSRELPALVESMKTAGHVDRAEITPIVSRGKDEVAQLGRAISEIQRVTVEVAEEQTALLHRGISEMFVNLARRNQSLLERQIQFIDGLESVEEDPDQLENLFRLDHLATRMRRNAESLLVLAGGEPSRRRGEPVGITSIIRVAVSEIEDYPRVDIRSIDDSVVSSSAAVDLAHLMSELLENATQFSPPESRVDVVGHRTLERSYQITIADHGIGLTEERLAESNRTLAEPAVVGLDMGRSLGFTVVSLLAQRLGLTVRLTPTPLGGVTAVVSLPTSVLRDPNPEIGDHGTGEGLGLTADLLPKPTTEPRRSETVQGLDLFDIFGSPSGAIASATDATEEPVEPRAGQSSLPPPPIRSMTPTKTVLPRRVPSHEAIKATEDPPANLANRTARNSARSPEQIREMLSQYRGGLQRGHNPTDDIPADQSSGARP